ncbi:hypothetical protein FB446DRAFT_790361 [Lentinula raphanica]|nr:hypothetical protein FB446DRAFT_790361 [Lentinula raphanica]
MFKRIARKRKRLEEEEALGIDEEMRKALGINAVNTDSDESESDSDQNDPDEDESEVSEQASADESDILDEEDEEDGEGQSQAEEEVSEVGDMVDADEPPAISKRALKKASFLWRSMYKREYSCSYYIFSKSANNKSRNFANENKGGSGRWRAQNQRQRRYPHQRMNILLFKSLRSPISESPLSPRSGLPLPVNLEPQNPPNPIRPQTQASEINP